MMNFIGHIAIITFAAVSLNGVVASSQDVTTTPSFMRAMTGYNYLKFDECHELKVDIPHITYNTTEDGDRVETVTYTQQNVPYVAYKLCTDCSLKRCGDSSFLAPLGTVIGNLISFTRNHCSSCYSSCFGEDVTVVSDECQTCHEECAAIHQAEESGTTNDPTDETTSLWCNPAYEDSYGAQYYSKATCGRDGHTMIGLFSDNQCTVQINSSYSKKFSYNMFNAMESFCMDCEANECYSEESLSLECVNGKNKNSAIVDDMNVCTAYQKVSKAWVPFSSHSGNASKVFWFFFFLLAIAGIGYYAYPHVLKYLDEQKNAQQKIQDDGEQRKESDYAVMS